MDATLARVRSLYSQCRVYLPSNCQSVELVVRRLDPWVDSAHRSWRNRLRHTAATAERPKHTGADRQRRAHVKIRERDCQLRRRVQRHVIGHVAEVPLVADAVSAAQRRLTVTRKVI